MIDQSVKEFESNFTKIQDIIDLKIRKDSDELRAHRLIRANEELLKDMQLELANTPRDKKNPSKFLLEKLQNKQKEITKDFQIKLGGKSVTEFHEKDSRSTNIQKIKFHEEKMNTLYEAKRNMEDANYDAGGIQNQLEKDFEMISKQKETVKLLNEDLIISNEMMAKIKAQNRKSLMIFMVAICVPFFAILIGLSVKSYRAVRSVTG